MEESEQRARSAELLRAAGATFAFVFGSRAEGRATPTSDLDVAAWWTEQPPLASDVLLEGRVDLLVLNSAPLEIAGRIAMWGELLFDDDPSARVHWIAETRKIYLDELPRLRQYEQDLREALARGR